MRTFFDGSRPGREVSWGAAKFVLPVLYFRDDAFGALFTADLDALRAAMPTDRLHPVRAMTRGRGFVYIAAYDYLETSAGPYGELAVCVPAVHGNSPPPPMLPSLFESRWPGFGAVVLHLPVTSIVARDAGRGVWGFAKFIADMDFENTPEWQQCKLSEGGHHILTLRVAKRGLPYVDRQPVTTYSVKDSALVRTEIPQTSIVRLALGAKGSWLDLGTKHPVAESIHALGIDPKPVMTRYYADQQFILPEGKVVEQGVRALDGYRGIDVPQGELRTTHLPMPALH